MNKIIIEGYDDKANNAKATIAICFEDVPEGTKTITFEEFDFTCKIKDLLDAIDWLKIH